MFMDRKTLLQDVNSFQICLYIQCDRNQNPQKLFDCYQHTFLKFILRVKRSRVAANVEEQQSLCTDTAPLQDFL